MLEEHSAYEKIDLKGDKSWSNAPPPPPRNLELWHKGKRTVPSESKTHFWPKTIFHQKNFFLFPSLPLLNASFDYPSCTQIFLNLTSIVSFLFSLVDISTFIVFVWSPIEGKERGNLYRGKRWQTFCSIEYKTTFQSQPFHHFLNVSTKASVLIWNYLDLRFDYFQFAEKNTYLQDIFGPSHLSR